MASGILGRLARSEAGRDPQTAAALEAQLPPMPVADIDVDALESAPLGMSSHAQQPKRPLLTHGQLFMEHQCIAAVLLIRVPIGSEQYFRSFKGS